MPSAEEAVVLHDLLCRWFDRGAETSPVSAALHPAERAVLDVVLTAQSDKQRVAPFEASCAERLVAARATVAERHAPAHGL